MSANVNSAANGDPSKPQPVTINVFPPMANLPQFPQRSHPSTNQQSFQQPNYPNQQPTDGYYHQDQQSAPVINSQIPDYYFMEFYNSNSNTTEVELPPELTATPDTKDVRKWRPKHVKEYLSRMYEESKDLPT